MSYVNIQTRGYKGECITLKLYEDIWGPDKSEPELAFDETVGPDGLLSYKIDWSQIEKKEGKRRVFYIKLYDKKKNLLYKPYIDKPSAAFYTDPLGKVTLLAGSNLKFDESTPGMALVAIEDGGDVGNTCEPLIWGKKFTCTERKKVIQIAENLGIGKDKIEGANWLMAVMALETGSTFDPGIRNSLGYTGLIQFGKTTAKSLGTTTDTLKKMSVIEQLDYVEKYLGKYKSKLTTLTDVYLAVLYPKACGHGEENDYIVFDDSKKAYKANPLFFYEDDEVNKDTKGRITKRHGKTGGKTYIWEVKMALQSWYSRGLPKKNKCKTDASTCEFGSKKGSTEEVCENCGKIHLDLRGNNSKWISQFSLTNPSQACYRACVKILSNYGVTCVGLGNKLDKTYSNGTSYYSNVIQALVQDSNGNLINDGHAREAIQYVDLELEKGNPIVIGVDKDKQEKTYNWDNTTEHFIVLIGRNCENNKISYSFWEVGTYASNKETKGVNPNNKLFLGDDNILKGNKPGSSINYTMVQVRKNK